MVAKEGERGPGRTGSFGLADVQTSRNRMGKQGLLCNTGSNTQYPVIKHHGKECEKRIYMYNGVILLYSRNEHKL